MSALAKIADMSALPRLLPARSRRAEQNRLAKERQRAREAEVGLVTLHVTVPASDAQLIKWLRTAHQGDEASFLTRALIVGAKFTYNSGNVRGGKKRIKGLAS